MKAFLQDIILSNWQRKTLSILCAIIIWFLVDNSITVQRTFVDVPIRIVNLPQDKTVEGLLPSGILNRRVTLTLTGYKQIVKDLEPGDIEVRIDAGGKGDEWIAEIGRKNLVSINDRLDLFHNVTDVQHTQLVLKMSRLITANVPVTIAPPLGEPPTGYQYLNAWPQYLTHGISGPEELVEELQNKGLELSFDLSQIRKEELDSLEVARKGQEEVRYKVPGKWKRVAIPFHNNALEEINDPAANFLQIEFLRKELLAIDRSIPISVFFPMEYRPTLNPDTYQLEENLLVKKEHGLFHLEGEFFTRDVSRLFLDVVRDHIEIKVIPAPKSEPEALQWSVHFVNMRELENHYLRELNKQDPHSPGHSKSRDYYLRERFREYARGFELINAKDVPLSLTIKLSGNTISVTESEP